MGREACVVLWQADNATGLGRGRLTTWAAEEAE